MKARGSCPQLSWLWVVPLALTRNQHGESFGK
jgi:hypothetical protein